MSISTLVFLSLSCSVEGYRLDASERVQSRLREESQNILKVELSQLPSKRPDRVAPAFESLARFLLAFNNPASRWQAFLLGHAQPAVPRALSPRALALPSTVAPIATLAVLTLCVVIHEAGHFSAARLQGIRVQEFSVGLGPQLLRVDRKESDQPDFVLRALPIGGFVTFPKATNRTSLEEAGLLKPGEKFNEVLDTPDLLENRPAREQAAVIVAGVMANLALAWACFFTTGISLGVPAPEPQQVLVTKVAPRSVAEKVGFHEGDRLLQVSSPVENSADRKPASTDGKSALESYMGVWRNSIDEHRPFDVEVQRGEQRVRLSVPELPSKQRLIGVEFQQKASSSLARQRVSPAKSAEIAVNAVRGGAGSIFVGLQKSFVSLFSGSKSSDLGLQGPVGITKMGSELASSDVLQLLEFGAIISLNLAVFNALPLPGLDGWLMTVLAIETAIGRKLSTSAQAKINSLAQVFFLFVFGRVLLADAGVAIDGAAVLSAIQQYGPSYIGSIAAGAGTAALVESLQSMRRRTELNTGQKTAKRRGSKSNSGSSSTISLLPSDLWRRASGTSQSQRARRSIDDSSGWLSRLRRSSRSS